MEEINTGGPAFGQVVELRCVRVDPCGGEEYEPALAQGGMTMRDYFASKALQGLCGSKAYAEAPYEVMAREAYQAADEMLKARRVRT